jgi:hypothetical protein
MERSSMPDWKTEWVKEHIPNAADFYAKYNPRLISYASPFKIIINYPLDGVYDVTLFNTNSNLIRFRISRFPECCAMMQMHAFSYASCLPYELVKSFLDTFFKNLEGVWFENKRIVIAMVEQREDYLFSNKSAWPVKTYQEMSALDIPKIDNPVITYPYFYEYFKNQAKFQEQLMWNANSGYVIHLIESVLKGD